MSKVVRVISGIPRYQELGATAYEETYSVASPISAGTDITLPNSGTYTSSELTIYLNGQKMTYLEDYAYVGTPPRTQVEFLFDLVAGDLVVFRKET